MALTFSRCRWHDLRVNSEAGWRKTWGFSQSHTTELMASGDPAISTPPWWASLLFWPQRTPKPIKTMHWPSTPNPFAPQQHATGGNAMPNLTWWPQLHTGALNAFICEFPSICVYMAWVWQTFWFAHRPYSKAISLWKCRHSKSQRHLKCKTFLVSEVVLCVVIHQDPVAQLKAEDFPQISSNKAQPVKPYHQIIKEQQSKCTIHEINIEQEDNLFF